MDPYWILLVTCLISSVLFSSWNGQKNVRTGRILMHFLGTSQWNSWHLIKGVIPTMRYPKIDGQQWAFFGGTIEPLACDVPFKDRMCLNFLFVWRCVFFRRWNAVVFVDEFLWWGCVFWVFHVFFGWLRRTWWSSRSNVTSQVETLIWVRPWWCQPAGEKSYHKSCVATLPRSEPFQR